MKTIRLLATGLFCAAAFLAPVFAQTSKQPSASGKIAVINSQAFGDEKAGITKIVTATKTLNREFAPAQTELNTMHTKLQEIANEIQALSRKVVIDPNAMQIKTDEGEKLQRILTRKQDDAKALYEKRQQELLGPVMQDISKALIDFAKQKGYTIIFDLAKDEAGLLIAIGDEKADVTKEFIAFYNAR